MDLNQVTKRLAEIDREISSAVEALEADKNASPALQAVVKEFERKSRKALSDVEVANEPLREHIVELEQAGDSAKQAAAADETINDDTRERIFRAHADICHLKSNTAA